MPVFTLYEFEQIGLISSSTLRLLGHRELSSPTVSEAKRWLSEAVLDKRLQSGRFYHWTAMGREIRISFYAFEDGRLCPLRIWHRPECRGTGEPEWIADFEGVPGWSAFASLEPRWRIERSVPRERSWMGRSRRDWQQRDCWFIAEKQRQGERAA